MTINQAEDQLKNGNYDKAIELYKEALIQAGRIDSESEEARCFMRLGLLYWNVSRLNESSDMYKKALSINQKISLKNEQEGCLTALEIYKLYSEGKDFRSSRKYEKSIESFKKAINLARKINSKEHELKCLRQLSLTYWELNDLQEFFPLNKEALKIAKILNHKLEEGRCLINIGGFYLRLENYSDALKNCEDALEIIQKLKNTRNEGECLTNIGLIFVQLGNYERALEYLLKALSADKEIRDDFYISIDLNNIGETFRRKGLLSDNKEDFYKALSYFNDSITLARKISDIKTETKVLNNIGLVNSYLKNYQSALRNFQEGYKKAEEINDIETKGMIINNTGVVYYNLGNYVEATKFYKRAIDLAFKIKSEQILWEAYSGTGQCYEKKDEFTLALGCYKKAIDIIDHIRSQLSLDTYKVGFVRDKLKVYEFLIDLLYRLNLNSPSENLAREIFHTVEKAKARAFLECLQEAKIDIRANLSPALKEKEIEISNCISLLSLELSKSDISEKRRKELLEKLGQAEEEYMRLISKMRIEIPELANLVSPEPCYLEQVQQQLLDEKTALIEYFLVEQKSFMFFITKNNFDLYSLPSKEKIENSIKAYLKILSMPLEEKFSGALTAKRLFKELLFPIEKISDSIENLLIIPDGTLYYLPFETLVLEPHNHSSGNDYLINRYKVSYAPSSSALLFLSEKKVSSKTRKDLLAFGNPVYALRASSKNRKNKTYKDVLGELYLNQGFDFSPLPHSKREILEISKYFKKNKKDIYLGDKAKEETIKNAPLKDYQIIHFACHGFLDDKLPLRSALVLSLGENKEEDGFLQVREIYNLRLNADLVVLSACQTGKGSLERAEGILGLPRIFFYAGARSVLLTLWRISDKATAIFMDHFYRCLSEGNDKAQALRLAKIKMINSNFSHPYYWAAFVLNGDSNSKLNF
jgi:CHAT domain-containing protein